MMDQSLRQQPTRNVSSPEGSKLLLPAEGVFSRFEARLYHVLYGVLFVGLFGYVFFTLNPENLARFPIAAVVYKPSMVAFAVAQSLLFVALAWVPLSRGVGSARASALLIGVSFVGFLAEYIGTSTGFPFGSYAYTDLMGPKIGDRVPFVIPPSWFAVGLPCYLLAARYFSPAASPWISRFFRLAGGAWLLTTWDFVLDPAMSYLVPYWTWEEKGFFYNSPFVNFVGWFFTGLVMMFIFECFFSDSARDRLVAGLGGRGSKLYALNFVMPAGMCFFSFEWIPGAVVLGALTPLWLAFVSERRMRRSEAVWHQAARHV